MSGRWVVDAVAGLRMEFGLKLGLLSDQPSREVELIFWLVLFLVIDFACCHVRFGPR